MSTPSRGGQPSSQAEPSRNRLRHAIDAPCLHAFYASNIAERDASTRNRFNTRIRIRFFINNSSVDHWRAVLLRPPPDSSPDRVKLTPMGCVSSQECAREWLDLSGDG